MVLTLMIYIGYINFVNNISYIVLHNMCLLEPLPSVYKVIDEIASYDSLQGNLLTK